MNFTGERFVPALQGEIRLEHYHRYALIVDMIQGKTVLDIACGEGYGSVMLAQRAQQVVGVDISVEAIHHAQESYGQISNLSFLTGSATSTTLTTASFDVIVSFETVEHLMEQEQMLAELRRLLKPTGFLVISSPNRDVYRAISGSHNEFHVRELDFEQFDRLLRRDFRSVRYFGQQIQAGSTIWSLDDIHQSIEVWTDDGAAVLPGSHLMPEPVYFVALCAARAEDFPVLNASVVFPKSNELIKQYRAIARWAQDCSKEIDLVRSLNADLTVHDEQMSRSLTQKVQLIATTSLQIKAQEESLVELSAKLANETEETVRRGAWALDLDKQLRTLQTEHLRILGSHSFVITKPFRLLRRLLNDPYVESHKLFVRVATAAKNVYLRLPFSQVTRTKHRLAVARYVPWLLRSSRGSQSNLPLISVPARIQAASSIDPALALTRISIPSVEQPTVSVVIPVYGKIEFTLRCLLSISDRLPKASIEVIVIDDCSPDDSLTLLRQVKGIRLEENAANLGFLRSCNKGASIARGEFVYMLNNDTEVTDGWLDELLATFDEFSDTGLVGSKLVYPDGRLQEAGGVIWRDASAWNYGRMQDPSEPSYNYAREVDYCSGASIMVPKKLWDQLGGFDEHYLPAYCEDSDLALKIRALGLRVLYQPASTIIHYEGVSSGTDLSQGVKAHQVDNTRKLYTRWREQLLRHQEPGVDADKAKDRCAQRRVLVLDHCTPTPDQDSGSITVTNLLLLLREMNFQVTFIPEDNFCYVPRYTVDLQRVGIEVLYAPYVSSVEQHLREYGDRYDLAFLFRPSVIERNLKALRKYAPRSKLLYHTIDLHFLRMSREAELLNDSAKLKAAAEMKQRELDFIRIADASIVHSTTEFDLIKPEVPDSKIHIFPVILDIRRPAMTFAQRRNIAFVGGYQHTPNVDAVQFFANDVMPLLRERLKGVCFYAIGSKPPPEVQSLASEDVVVTGYVEDLDSLLDRMRVSVAPLRFGAGIKGKIGTTMSIGLPTVGTSIAVEGMSLTAGSNILVADDAPAIANAVVRLYQDSQLWQSVSDRSLEFAKHAWGAEAAWKTLAGVLFDIDLPVVRGTRALRLYTPRIQKPSNRHGLIEAEKSLAEGAV